jgi:hypothetical protein
VARGLPAPAIRLVTPFDQPSPVAGRRSA